MTLATSRIRRNAELLASARSGDEYVGIMEKLKIDPATNLREYKKTEQLAQKIWKENRKVK